MKRILLSSVMLSVLSGHVFAEDAKVSDNKSKLEISGSAAAHIAASDPTITYYDGNNAPSNVKTNQKSTAKTDKDSSLSRISAGEAELVFNFKHLLENGLLYGGKISVDAMKGDTGVDDMYIFFEKDKFGTINVGNVKGPEAKFIVDGQRIIGGTCGVDGTVLHDVDFATGVISPVYVIGYTSRASKIAYYTPRVQGFQFGIAITPDTKHVGHNDKSKATGDSGNGNDPGIFAKGKDDKERPSGKNNIAVGINHHHQFNDKLSTKLSFVYVTEDTRSISTNCYVGDVDDNSSAVSKSLSLKKASTYHVSGNVSYGKMTIAAGYLNNGKSRLPQASQYIDNGSIVLPGGFMSTKDGNSGYAYNFGGKYQVNDKLAIAAVYHHTSRKVTSSEKTHGNMYTVTADYVICAGLKIFGEIDHLATKSSDTACALRNLVSSSKNAIKKQRATIFVLGAKVAF